MKSSRCKIVRIEAHAIMALLGNWRLFDCVSLPIIKGLPDGYRIDSVQWSFESRGLDLLIEHESFPEVEAGCKFPDLYDGWATTEAVVIPDSMKRRYVPTLAEMVEHLEADGIRFQSAEAAVGMASDNDLKYLGTASPLVDSVINHGVEVSGTVEPISRRRPREFT